MKPKGCILLVSILLSVWTLFDGLFVNTPVVNKLEH